MRKYLQNINWRRVGKIALVAVPVLVWDVVYYLVTKLYEGCTYIDAKGEKVLDNIMGTD